MKKRVLCWLLVLVMVASLMPSFAFAAESDRVQVSRKTSDTQDGDLHMTKTLYQNSDGTYDIDIESWATGEVQSHVVNQAVPTDFVLILDQSGSMATSDMPTGYRPVAQTQWRPDDFLTVTVNDSGENGNSIDVTTHEYYYNVPGTDKYFPVYWKSYPTQEFHQLPANKGALDYTTYESFFDWGGRTYEYGQNDSNHSGTMQDVYYRDSDGAYYRVYTESRGLLLRYHLTPFYYDSFGVRHDLGTYTYAWLSVANNKVNVPLYTNSYINDYWSGWSHKYEAVRDRANNYMPFYKDENGVETQVPGSIGVEWGDSVFYTGTLYEKNADQPRLTALQDAVNNFVDLVQVKATESHVNHKVAIVGFSSSGSNYGNNEILSGVELEQGSRYYGTDPVDTSSNTYYFPTGYAWNGAQYGSISNSDYTNSLQDVSTPAGKQNLQQAVNAVTAYGGTEPQYGFYMAKNILDPNYRAETTYTMADGTTAKRNTVVVFFTDGAPGNYGYSDQIAAANTVVSAANSLKTDSYLKDNLKVFSIGIFASGDDQPLTFTTGASSSYDGRDNYFRTDGDYFYFRGNKTSETVHNDTIKDYMECVSSKYPNAANFLNHSGTNATGTSSNNRGAENQDQMTYYMRVTDADGLERAFASIASTVDTSTTSATLNDSAVLKDTVYTGDFDVSGASVEAKSVKVEMVNGEVKETGDPGTASPTVTDTVRTNGRLSVTGFDYSGLYTADNKPGEKLVVTIKNLVPKTSGHLWSNSGDASIYPGPNSSDAVIAVASPEENIGSRTIVMDFGAKAVLAQKADGDTAATNLVYATRRNGEFQNSGAAVTYSFGRTLSGAASEPVDLSFDSVDSALVYGKQVTGTNADGSFAVAAAPIWEKVNVIPANTVYFDDSIANTEMAFDGSCSGYNARVPAEGGEPDGYSKQVLTFEFTGTGIDVYCTTDGADGWIQATVDEGNKQPYTNTKYAAGDALHNIPVISFRDLGTDAKHTLVITALTGANFRLDGIRVYNPVNTNQTLSTQPGDTIDAVYAKANEQNAVFMQVRQYLLSKAQFESVSENGVNSESTVAGAVFIDTNDVATSVADYTAAGPKNEVYLASGQGVAFQISGWANYAETHKVMVGLSVPGATSTASASVAASGRTGDNKIPVSSETHMFYEITPESDGTVFIYNTGSAMVSVTDLKITGPTEYTVTKSFTLGAPIAPESEGGALMVQPMMLMRYVEDFDPEAVIVDPTEDPGTPAEPGEPQDPDTPSDPGTPDQPDDPKPGWNDDAYNPINILRTFFKLLLQNLGSLFGGLGNW